jgi:DNA-binding transcriptional regulator GbsR (MarR family)
MFVIVDLKIIYLDMDLDEAKQKFIHAWGGLGSKWGINKTMAQLHALLFIASEPMSSEEMMDTLQISRGNVNMNVRELMDWGLVQKVYKAGERRDFYVAEKDVWKVAKQVVKERKKREIEPIIALLEELEATKNNETEDYKAFMESIANLKTFTENVDNSVEKMMKADESWFISTLFNMIKNK